MGPELLWDEQPELPTGAIFLGEADGVPYAAVRGERALTVSGFTTILFVFVLYEILTWRTFARASSTTFSDLVSRTTSEPR